jgi:cytochrome P450
LTTPIPTIPMKEESYWQDPYPVLREIREHHRVARTDQGHVAVLRWEDAVSALKGTEFIAEGIEVLERRGFEPGDPMHTWRKNAIGVMEGDGHRRVRSLAANALSKRRMDDLRPLIRKHAHSLIDRLIDAGEIDALAGYAAPLPRQVMMDFLGISPDELEGSHRAMGGVAIVDCFGPNVTPALRDSANRAIQQSMDQVALLYESRRSRPRDDLLTHLMQAKDERGVLSEGELLTLFSTIFGSGASTASIIASGLLELVGHPEQASLLRRDPARWKKGASEETLRCRPSITAVGQKAAEDIEAFGVKFERGEPISVILGSANRDSRYWEDPERFDIRRDPKTTSLTFGIGAHVCLGHAMARATVEEALATFVSRCDELTLRNEPRWIPFVMENKLDALRIGFVGRPA